MRALTPVLLLLLACDPALSANLLTVTSFDPLSVQPGMRFQVVGSGFDPGREAIITFEGEIHRPGQVPEPTWMALTGEGESASLITGTITRDFVEGLGGRGTFRGGIRVDFQTHGTAGRVSGSLAQVELDVVPTGESRRLDLEVERIRDASALLAGLGITTTTDPGGDVGLFVDAVLRDSAAFRAGISKGDRIVSVDGVRVSSVADFLPSPADELAAVVLDRPGISAPVRVDVSLEEFRSGDGGRTLLLSWVAALVVLFFLFVAPTARLTTYLVARNRGPTPSVVLRSLLMIHQRPSTLLGRLRSWGWWLVVGLAALLALASPVFASQAFSDGIDLGLILLAVFACELFVRVTVDKRGSGLARLLRFLRDSAILSAGVLAVVVLSGSLRVTGIAEVQGGYPWEWLAMSHPASAACFPLFVLAGLVRDRPLSGQAEGAGHQVADRVGLFLLSGLATTMFLGAWNVPGFAGDPLSGPPLIRALAVTLFAGKSCLLLFLAVRIRLTTRPNLNWVFPLALLLAAGAFSIAVEPWPSWIEQVTQVGLSIGAAAVVLYAILARVFPRASGRPLLHFPEELLAPAGETSAG